MANCTSSINPSSTLKSNLFCQKDYIVTQTLDKMVRSSTKRKRDPARPKLSMTPFLYYACEQRNILKSNGDKMTLPEQSKYIAGLWKVVTDKSKYVDQAKIDRARYDDQMSRYEPPKKIKRPRSSYAFFMKDIRASISEQYPDKNPRELMGDIAKAWRAITDTAKEKYVKMATEDKTRYTQEKAAESNTE